MKYFFKWIWLRLILHGWFLFRVPARRRWNRQHPHVVASPEANSLRTAEVKFYCTLWQFVFWGCASGLVYAGHKTPLVGWHTWILVGSLVSLIGLFQVIAMHHGQIWWGASHPTRD